MCGIVGIIERTAPQGFHRLRIKHMMKTIQHRGPDGEGLVELAGGVTLGHVRLAIVDLNSSANQPMQSISLQSSIVYNGELYNHLELRETLIKQGFRFKTRSDTEVILNAYECWGNDFIHKLNGMFAFALFDAKDQSVLLARDRLGIKPLYYFADTNRIFFGSEIKAVRVAMDMRPDIDVEALLEYLTFQNNFGERTLVENVKLLPAGCIAKITRDSSSVYPKRYWSPHISPSNNSSEHHEKQLSTSLKKVINDQLQADVPVNSFMSGGLDSCAIASIASANVGRIKTFTCGFDMFDVTQTELLFDERKNAELMSNYIGSEHYEVVLKADDFLSQMTKWAWHAEEPRVGTSFPNYCASYLASRFTKVCFAGTGADELFGGYPWRYTAALNATSDSDFIDKYYGLWNRMLSPRMYDKLVAPISTQFKFDPFIAFQTRLNQNLIQAQNSSYKYADAGLLFEMETFLHGLLISEDKASMAHGLEVRVPLIDNRLIDLALTIPFNEKVCINQSIQQQNYGKGSSTMPAFSNGKLILRKVLASHVPTEISSGRKQGFSPPVETWFRKKMHSWLANEVFSNQAPMANYIDMKIARQLWIEHQNGLANHRLFIWGIIALHLFITEFLRSPLS